MKKNILLILAVSILIFLIYAAANLVIPISLANRATEFEIRKGETFAQIVDDLYRKEMVKDRWVFLVLGRVAGLDRKIRAGYYPLRGTMSPWSIFNVIKRGKIIEYEVTIVPGDSLMEIADKFSALGIIGEDEFLKICSDRDFLYSLDVDAPSLEGYIFPDTYRFPKGLDIKDALSIMVDKLKEKYNEDLLLRTFELGLTEREALTMASIIEKEAVIDEERPIIAGVYYNRLKKRMHLQADPTSIYGIKSFKEKITKQDLMRVTRYNTYMIKGLPPGPIASPGLKSLKAALYPADVPYLYFVSNNDGSHKFSVTLGAHNEAVKGYRDKRKKEEE